MSRWRYIFAAAMLTALLLLSGPVPYTAPNGDLDGNGTVDVIDVQCAVLLFEMIEPVPKPAGNVCATDAQCKALSQIPSVCRTGFTQFKQCLPACVSPDVKLGPDPTEPCQDPKGDSAACLGLTHKRNADMNCDGAIGNQDLLFLVAVLGQKTDWQGGADQDGDGRLNGCDDDLDGDGDPDVTDCAPDDPLQSSNAVEICNGLDDDCDGVADDGLGAVSCGKGPCAHSVQSCLNGEAQECNPLEGAKAETCNGLDDDCDGVADDGLGLLQCGSGICMVFIPSCVNGQPQQCNGQGEPQTEVCDGKDNDCDLKVDEEGAVGCTTWYADKDSDNYGSDTDKKCLCKSEYPYKLPSGGDCYDGNKEAKPYQVKFYSVDRGDGSYDYNCDSKQTMQYDTVHTCSPTCQSTAGWYAMKPLCGKKSLYVFSCFDFMGMFCDTNSVSMTAACN